MGGRLFKCGTCLTMWSRGGRFFEGERFLSVDAYSRNIFNNACFLFIEGGTGIFGFAVLAIF